MAPRGNICVIVLPIVLHIYYHKESRVAIVNSDNIFLYKL